MLISRNMQDGLNESYSAVFNHGHFSFFHFDKSGLCIESKEDINKAEMEIFLRLLESKGFITTKVHMSECSNYTLQDVKDFFGMI